MPKSNLVYCSSIVHMLGVCSLFVHHLVIHLVIVCCSILFVTPPKWLFLVLIVASERKIPPQQQEVARIIITLATTSLRGSTVLNSQPDDGTRVNCCVGKKHFATKTRGREDYRSREDKVVRLDVVALTTR